MWERSPYGRYLTHGELAHFDVAAGLQAVLVQGAIYVAGWTLMTAAMMLPTTLPLLEIFRRMTAQRRDRAGLLALVIAGYLGVWLAFGAALAMAAGTVWDPVWVGVVAGLGSATGELTGYGLGYYGRQAVPIDRSRCWRLAERGFRRWGLVALFVLAVIPNPVFDALGILAGCLRYPVVRYWLATAAGKIIKFGALAYLAEVAATWMRVAM